MRIYLITSVALIAVLSGCGKQGPQGASGTITVEVPASPTVPVAETVTQTLIDTENAYRASLGQTALTQGLSCTVQALQSGQWLSAASPGYNAGQGVVVVTVGSVAYAYLITGAFDQGDTSGGSLNTELPASLQAMFAPLNYRIVCNGQLVVTDSGYYQFDLNSDDGSILTIDGAQVVNNDGNHSMTLKSGIKNLHAGVHTFNMQYAQTGAGNFGLVLKANGSVVPSTAFYH